MRRLCISLTLGIAVGMLTSCASSAPPPQNAVTSPLESKLFNSRIWPEEASRLVRTGEQPKSCIDTGGAVFVVNDEDSFVFMNDGGIYFNELQWSCNNVLVSTIIQNANFGRRQLCEGISVTLPDRFGGNPNAQCFLGKFAPVRIADATEADVIIVNEGQAIRRPR